MQSQTKDEKQSMNEKIWAWQPFGPDASPLCFMVAGSHYRGWPVIKVTNDEKEQIERGERFTFKYNYTQYVFENGIMQTIGQELFLTKYRKS